MGKKAYIIVLNGNDEIVNQYGPYDHNTDFTREKLRIWDSLTAEQQTEYYVASGWANGPLKDEDLDPKWSGWIDRNEKWKEFGAPISNEF